MFLSSEYYKNPEPKVILKKKKETHRTPTYYCKIDMRL
jgi:hypothetical protein